MSHSTHPLRGFALAEPLVNVDNLTSRTDVDTPSAYTQQGSHPGHVTGGEELSACLPIVSGGQADDLDLIAFRPGVPRIVDGAGFGYRVDGDADDLYRSWNEPNMVMGYRPVEWTTTSVWGNVAAVTLPESQKVIVLGGDANAAEPISYWIWAPSTRTWSNRAEISATSTANLPAICVLRSGRILAFLGDSSDGSAEMWRSDDDGDTWERHAPNSIRPAFMDTGVDQVRMMEDANGNLLLVAVDIGTQDMWQFASDDDGANWEEIETIASFSNSLVSMMKNINDQIVLMYINASKDVKRRIIEDAYDPISGNTEASVDGTTDADACEAVTDADGICYAIITGDDNDKVKTMRSLDGGSNWLNYTDGLIQVCSSVASPTNFRHTIRAAACSGGEIVALFTSGHITAPATDGSLISLWLGGWSNVEQFEANGTRGGRRSWGDTSDTVRNSIFLPTETLENYGWTHTGTTATLVDGYHRYAASVATAYDSLTVGTNTAGVAAVLVEMIVVSGGSVSDGSASYYHNRRNGSTMTTLAIRCSTTQFRIRDLGGTPATLGTIDVDMTSPVQFLIIYNSATAVQIMYKRPQATRWITGPAGTLQTDATGASTDIHRAGCLDTTTTQVRFGLIAWCNKQFGMGIATGGTLSGRCRWGKQLSQRAYPVRELADTDGKITHLSAVGGACTFHETWDVSPSYDYGIRNLHPVETPSVTQPWRSSDDATDVVLVWDLGSDRRLTGSWCEALGLFRANIATATLEVSTNADPTTWVEIGDYDAKVVDAGTFTRTGSIIKASAGSPIGKHFFGAGCLRGAFVIFDPDGTPLLRKIDSNEGGSWGGSGMGVSITLEGIDGTEPTSGDLHIYASSGVVICQRAAPTAYRRIRLTIPAQSTVEGYFEVGAMLLGAVWVAGRQWSRGWSWRYRPLVRTSEDEVGRVYVEARTDDEELCYIRELTVAWQDGVSDASLRAQITRTLGAADGSPSLVANRDTWRQIVGLLSRSRGGTLPTIAIMDVPRERCTLTDASLFSFGRLAVGQTIQRNNVQGKEGLGEIERLESITHVELG